MEEIPNLEKDLVKILKGSILPIIEKSLKEQKEKFDEMKELLEKSNTYIESKADGKLLSRDNLFAHTHPNYVTPESRQYLQ